MKRNNIKKALPILQAIAEGKSIQWRDPGNYHSKYEDINVEELNEYQIINYSEDYRIKPVVKFRPFSNTEECWQEMKKHQPFGWVKLKDTESGYYMLKGIASQVVIGFNETPFSYKKVFEDYTFADELTFGIKVEEE